MQSYLDGATMDEMAALLDQLQLQTSNNLAGESWQDLYVWFTDVDQFGRKRFEDSVKRAMGIDAKSILDPVLADETRRKAISENVALIRGLTREYHGEVMSAIVADYRGDGFPDGSNSLAGRIQNILRTTKARASFIARDQTAKLNSTLAEARQEDAGITHYEWRTAGDIRVVGAPGGPWKPSKQHGNHYQRDGKVFSWKNPPLDGHPGHAPNCRCIAAPVIDPTELRMVDLSTGTVRYAAVAV
jgi:SPP1 gp7 family putative phage head morphogenesis protein